MTDNLAPPPVAGGPRQLQEEKGEVGTRGDGRVESAGFGTASQHQRNINGVRGMWAVRAAVYARQQVTPLYQHDETPTQYEKGQLHSVAAHFRDGYFAALDALEGVMLSDSETPQRHDRTRPARIDGASVDAGEQHPATNTAGVAGLVAPHRRDLENEYVPLSAAELDELEKRLVADEPHIRQMTRLWAVKAIQQLRAEVIRLTRRLQELEKENQELVARRENQADASDDPPHSSIRDPSTGST